MDFTDNFDSKVWEKTDPDTVKGFVLYTIVRPQPAGPKLFKYAVKEIRDDDDDVNFDMVSLEGFVGKSNPLVSIRNCELILKDGAITGINVDGDCLVKKSN